MPLLEARHGAETPEVADLLDELVLSLWRGGKAREGEALGLAERAVRIRETNPSSPPEGLATSLTMLAHVHSGLDDLAGARALYERALALREQARGPDHPEVGRILVNVGSMAAQLGEYPAARAAFERSLEIKRRTLPPGDPSLAASLLNLANIDYFLADYDAARSGYEAALAIWEAAHGPEHPRVGDAHLNLGNVLSSMGDYPGALAAYQRGIAVLRKVQGGQDAVVHAINNYAMALRATGQHAEARRLLEEALEMQRASRSAGSPRAARTLTNLAAVEIDERSYAAARDHLRQASALMEKAFGPENPNVLPSLVSLADVLLRLGEIEEAGAVVTRARALAATHLPADHPRTAFIDQIEGRLRARAGDLEGARQLTGRALAARESRLGPWHPDVVESRTYLAALLWALGERGPALDTAIASGADLDRSLRETVRVLPEARALELAALRPHPEAVLFTGLLDDPDRRAAWIEACFDWTLRARGLVLEEISVRRRTAVMGGGPEALAALARLSRASDRLAAVWIRGADSGEASTFSADLERAQREREEAEAALAAVSAGFRRLQSFAPINARQVATAIPEASVLIEVVRVGLRPSVMSEGDDPASERYVALRLGHGGAMAFADLGRADAVDRLVGRWRAALQRAMDDGAQGAAGRDLDTAAAELARAVWDPLARLAGDARRVFLVPDGSLYLVNMPALPLADGRFQIEGGPAIHILDTGRDLVRLRDTAPTGASAARLLALGGVNYSPGAVAHARGSTTCPSMGGIDWPPLPESRREVDVIRDLFDERGTTLALTGAAATESRLRSEAPRHEVLHLATHGFFVDDACAGEAPNPLLLSGLVLAASGGAGGGAHDDGVLTAEEVAALDLSGVRLAVLSACNTGAGGVTAGEGVFGLRRALEVAGAGSVVMSLWPVPDREGRRWMTSFYTAWLDGQAVFDAARRASLARLADLRRREAYPHPYLWGGFVTAGDWNRPGAMPRPRGAE